MKKNSSLWRGWMAAWLGLLLAPSGYGRPPAPAARIPKWSVYEIPLKASGTYANPSHEASVTATFTGPAGAKKTVAGFWDGETTFKLRFTPNAEGRWRYTTTSPEGRPYFEGFWHPTPEYGDIRRLVDFFTQPELTYWKMTPDTLSLTGSSRVYCLSEPGQQYVVYAADGGTFELTLPSGAYRLTHLVPATGARREEVVTASGTPLRFFLPAGADAVLFLRKNL